MWLAFGLLLVWSGQTASLVFLASLNDSQSIYIVYIDWPILGLYDKLKLNRSRYDIGIFNVNSVMKAKDILIMALTIQREYFKFKIDKKK